MITVQCSCGKSFDTFPCHIKAAKATGTKCETCRVRRKRFAHPCAQCRATLELKESVIRYNSSGRFFCGRKCMGAWRTANFIGTAHPNYKEKVEVFCQICGLVRSVHRSQARYLTYLCGASECRGEWARRHNTGLRNSKVAIPCAQCGKEKIVWPSHRDMYKRLFCSMACRSKWNKANYRGSDNPNWHGGGRTDPFMRSINQRMAAGMRSSLIRGKEGKPWQGFVDYDMFQLRDHLSSTMPDGFTWDDFDKLHIDHKRPIATFSFKDASDSDFKACWALSNLQLLPALENMRKSAKYTPGLAVA